MVTSNHHQLLIKEVNKLSGKWFVLILVNMPLRGDRFTPLQNRLNIAPSRLSENLKKLIDLNIVYHLSPTERRHPLLPEYQLTQSGLVLKKLAEAMLLLDQDKAFEGIMFKKWHLAILLAILFGDHRFVHIKETLKPITSKVLSSRLKDLQDKALVVKTIICMNPVIHEYKLAKDCEDHLKLFVDESAHIFNNHDHFIQSYGDH